MAPIERNEIPQEILEFIGEIIAFDFPEQGCTSDVVVLTNKEKSFVLKRSKNEQFKAWLMRESDVLEILSKHTDLTPKIYMTISRLKEDEGWILMEYIPGVTLREALQDCRNEKQRQELIFQFGQILRKLHDTPCPPKLSTDKLWLDNMLEDAAFNLKNYEVDGSEKLLQELHHKRPKDYQQTLIHGDFTIDNVMVHNSVIVKIIDWSGGANGDPRYDVALAIRKIPQAFEKEADRDIFFAGYGGRIIDDKEYHYFADGLYEFF
ncbi:phosphotransferase family protein [Ornithinibacillus bavariensis]|uniref:phosphotransferase family protein n=1 Tax=Ornithinibacillus bavariensis TaxID=545502 RepID=UPI003D20173B